MKFIDVKSIIFNWLMTPSTRSLGQIKIEKRFDVIAKYLYAIHREKKINSDYFTDLYLSHIKVLNNYIEKGKYTGHEKHSQKEFLQSFDALLNSIKEKGFDEKISKIWIDKSGYLLNGAHRMAASLVYKVQPKAEIHSKNHGQLIADYKYFQNKTRFVKSGLKKSYSDRIGLEYVKLKPTTYGVTLFPAAIGNDETVEELISTYADIIYKKEIRLNKNGSFNFIKLVYQDEKWLGNWKNEFAGTWDKVHPCFPNKSKFPLRFFIIDTKNPKMLTKLKTRIRRIYGIKNHSVHINDTHKETLEISQALLNTNSIHLLNYSKQNKYHVTFINQFNKFKKELKRRKINKDDVIITSSSVLSAYGLRDCKDIDFLTNEKSSIKSFSKLIQNHESQISLYPHKPDELIYNPNHHFYHEGLKFCTLENVLKFKSLRREDKDKRDIALIKPLIRY